MKTIFSMILCIFCLSSVFAQRPYYGGGHHSESHGGHYEGGRNGSRKGSHYVNSRTNNHYGIHKTRSSNSSSRRRKRK